MSEQPQNPAQPQQQPQTSGDTVRLISPSDYRVYRVPAAQRDAYLKAGYVTPTADINREEIHKVFSGWTGAGKSFMYSTVAGVPLAKSLIAGVSTTEQAKEWQENFDAAAREHPVLDFAGHALGTMGTVAGAGALALGAGAAVGAGAAFSEGALGLAGGASALEAAGTSALTNAGLGAIERMDDGVLRHMADPDGKEKTYWDLNATIIDAALGAATPATLGGIGKALQYMGKKLGPKGQQLMRNAISKASEVDSVERQGRMGDLNAKLDEVLASGRKNPGKYVKSRLKIAGDEIETIKAAAHYKELSSNDTIDVQEAIRRIVGRDDRVHRRLADFYKKSNWTIDDMQKINQKIYREIAHDEPGIATAANARYIKAAEAVKNGMSKIVSDNDFSTGKIQAQKWATALKDYSDWELANAAIDKRMQIKDIREIATAMTTGAATGAAAGGIFGAFGGAGAAGAGGAAYQALKNVNSYHYGKAMKGLAKAFESSDKKLTDAVEAGLYGLPAIMHNATRTYTAQNYEDAASKVSAAKNDPVKSFENIKTHLDSLGIPEDVANEAAMDGHAKMQWLAERQPRVGVAPDIVSKGQPDPVQQRRFMGQVRTMQDPTYALAHPSRTNLEVVRTFYPTVLANAQQAILLQLQRNPTLPAASKHWASRVLGRPVNNLSSPTFSAMLAQARQSVGEQSGGAPTGPGPSRSSGASSQGAAQTRLGELQGGES